MAATRQATKQTSTKKRRKSKPEVVTEELKMIDRENFDWGVRLTAQPLPGHPERRDGDSLRDRRPQARSRL